MIKLLVLQKALKNNTTLKDEIIKSGLMNEKEYHKIVNPKNDSTRVGRDNFISKYFKFYPIRYLYTATIKFID